MQEVDEYGNFNPYQDPNYGRIPSFNVDSNGDFDSYQDADGPVSFLANLEGRYSIIGRSLVFQDANAV